jgi:Tol biopolymer transport system component
LFQIPNKPDPNPTIAFRSNRSGTDQVYVCSADGSNPIQLTSLNNGATGSPSWSADGKQIAIDSRVEGHGDTANPLDLPAAVGAAGTGSTANSGSATTATANDLIFGAGTTSGHFNGPGTGFTSRIITSPDGDIAEDKIVSSTGSYNATAPANYSNWVMQMVAFKAQQ